jgi:G3E family GTPase
MSDVPPYGDPSHEDLTKAYDTLDFLAGLAEAEEWAAQTPRKAGAALPLVIVTGGLGAGKTTLMRHLLLATHGLAITAIVNDAANLNIDAALISEATEDTLALENGCVCCSQSGGVARTLVEISNRRTAPDLVLLEASGIADPWALAQVTATVPGISLECVVTILDADGAEPANYLLRRQVAATDLLLLNKVDLVTRQTAARLAKRVTALAPRAQTLRTINCAIPCGIVFDRQRSSSAANVILEDAVVDDSAYHTASLYPKGLVDREALENCLETLPDGILRIKGFLRLKGAPDRKQLLQLVGRRWRWEPAGSKNDSSLGLAVIGLTEALDTRSFRSHFARAGLDWQSDH